jgi:hypothetical protein
MSTDPALRIASPGGNPDPTLEGRRDRPETGRQASPAAAIEPFLVPTPEACRLCAISEAGWHRLKSAARTPAPVRLGGKVLYRTEDLRLWVALGCPDRKTFEAYRSASRK